MKYRASLEDIKKAERFVNSYQAEYKDRISISFGGYTEKKNFFDIEKQKKKENFYERARCSGNFYAFVILPDGKVTVCEELYWHPEFLLGDLTQQSIEEVWNSKEALALYNLSRESEQIRVESVCKTCDEFASCHRQRGVCWKEVLYAYGLGNWDYPDPKCHYAPEPEREFYF
ncbi:MAG: SPASM domain-containing protein [bacterium]|nr:SPASM domain-containing protein [bacterium]